MGGMAWVWGNTGLLEQTTLQLYTALHNGADIFKSVDCDEKYAVSDPESCKIFDWQTDKMSLSFDSKELPKTKKKQPVPETTQEKPPKHEKLQCDYKLPQYKYIQKYRTICSIYGKLAQFRY